MDASGTSPVDNIFLAFNQSLEQESAMREEIRKLVKDLELSIRKMTTVLQHVHNQKSPAYASVAAKAKENLPAIVVTLKALQALVKSDDYYKFHDHWRNSFQQLVFLLAFITWLEQDRLIAPVEIETTLKISKAESPQNFGLELEDFLIGLTSLPSELARLCVNSVIVEDFSMPQRIQKFVSEVYAGFRLLNLKNDFLRKRYDSIKYDLKKIEEVVYDISIRKLVVQAAPS